jgi:hypothetical protein
MRLYSAADIPVTIKRTYVMIKIDYRLHHSIDAFVEFTSITTVDDTC